MELMSALLEPAWSSWSARMDRRVRSTQRLHVGHACCDKGAWDRPPDAEEVGGRVTATALYAMALMHRYRYDRAVLRPGLR